ncbi:piercer of microtubule wall 1 protein [Cygnus atratus]|uniref:piercer of microtubule wall 1 protein n=1 Tax=Cygnus atratus TaxID=8868 RepID=UPI0015D571AE|nr:piercer of microtubule wall 1 protein [Cygnus atratus]
MSRPGAPGGPGPDSRYRGGLQHPAGSRQPHPLYRTSSQAYGSRAPTVHEVPTTLHVTSHTFSNALAQCGMYRNNGLNTYLEKSHVTGPDNFITPYDTLNFHPSYNASRPSHC